MTLCITQNPQRLDKLLATGAEQRRDRKHSGVRSASIGCVSVRVVAMEDVHRLHLAEEGIDHVDPEAHDAGQVHLLVLCNLGWQVMLEMVPM